MQTERYSQAAARNKFLEGLNSEKPDVLETLRAQVFPILSQVNIKRAIVKIGPTYYPRRTFRRDQYRTAIEQYVKNVTVAPVLHYPDDQWLWLAAPIVAAAAKDLVPVKWSEMESSPDRRLADEMARWAGSYNLADDDWCLEAAAQTLLVWVIQENPEALCWAQLYYSTPVAEKPEIPEKNTLAPSWIDPTRALDFVKYPIVRCRCCGFVGPLKPISRATHPRFRVDAFRWLALFHTGTNPATIGRKFQVTERYVEIVIGKLYRFIGLTRRKPRGRGANRLFGQMPPELDDPLAGTGEARTGARPEVTILEDRRN